MLEWPGAAADELASTDDSPGLRESDPHDRADAS